MGTEWQRQHWIFIFASMLYQLQILTSPIYEVILADSS